MSKYWWFMTGFLSAQFMNLIFTATPEKAAKNLKDWWWATLIGNANDYDRS